MSIPRMWRGGRTHEPAPEVTEREVADRLYGGRKTIVAAPHRPPGVDELRAAELLGYAERPDHPWRRTGYDESPADEHTIEPREPDERP
jgi:hypothetical protein